MFVEQLEARRVLDSTVVFSELMYDPAGDDESLEWLELHNQNSIDMDISEWSIRGGVDYTFADGTIVPVRGYLVIASDPAALQAQTGFADAIGPYAGRLNNAGESLELVNNSNRVMDSLSYRNGGQWPVGPHGSGTTLAKMDALSTSPPAANWTTSEQLGGTPGALNFVTGEAARVSFDFAQPGATASVFVPTNDNLGTDWTSDTYVEGSRGETWLTGPTGVGFLSGAEQISYQQTVLADDPVAYWRFGETDAAQSAENLGLAGNAADGTYAADAGVGQESLLGEAGDGSLRISVAGASTPMQTNEFEKFSEIAGVGGTGRSLEAWVSLDAKPASVASLVSDGQAFVDLGMTLYVSSDAKLQTFVRTTGSSFFGITQIETEAQLQLGQPTHVVATWDQTSGDIKIFLDGVEAATRVVLGAHPNANPPQNTDNPLFIGKDGRNTAALEAVVDEVAIYNYALQSDRIATHFDTGQPTFANLFQTDIQSQMHNTSTSAYVRLPFEYEGGAALDQFTLPIRYDDGFVAYVNGQEVARRDVPAGDISFDSVATANRSVGQSLTKATIDLSNYIDKIQVGTNVLAIHGLNFDATNNDFLVLPELKAAGSLVTAADLPTIVINEVASAMDETFRLELLNTDDRAADLENYVLMRAGDVEAEYLFPPTTLASGEYLSLSEAQLGFDAADGDRLFLYSPEKSILVDAREATNRLRGRSTEHDGRWLFPATPTFGAANSFSFEDDVVINEIMYHARPQFGSAPITSEDLPFSESDEEWIELYNRGTTTVDLTGWRLDDAIEFDFPTGQSIVPDSYLVVARDAAALAGKYPGIADRIIGDFDGRLSNVNENIALIDANRNPADEVHYYEGGRWDPFADGGSSSLELRDPNADNAMAEAWAASDEGTDSDWVIYTYRGVANNPPGSNNPSTFNEFSFGLLDEGEILIDDIHVIEDPDGVARDLIQNSEFTGTFDRWRPVGNQHGRIVPDPEDPSNDVFHLRATGPEEHLQNRVETTLKSGNSFVAVSRGTEYEISFRAKWLGGSPQLNTRLFFNYLPRTTILSQPTGGGTPGTRNSTFETNIGPTYNDLQHLPVTPEPGEDIAVFVNAEDPNGVANLTIWYSVNEGPFVSTSMAPTASARYLGTIPGQANAAVVQFYVEGQDTSGATSLFPAAGPDSRALIGVGAGPTSTTGLQNIQIIMLGSEEDFLGQSTNLMSNDRIGSTVVYEGRVYYDTGIRLKGSEHGRPDTNRRGYSVEFPPHGLFRGVHRTIGIDRSGGWRFGRTFGQDEILIYQFFNRAGGFPSMFNDLIFVDGPTLSPSTAILQMARYTDTFLDSQYENGSEGTRYEYELIYTMVESGREARKAAQEGPSVFGIPVGRDMGEDKEAYRHNFLIKNNLARDDYGPMIEMAKAFSLSGDAFHDATQELLDVDEWLRSFAALSLSGANDNYNAGSQHNAIFYERPSDGRMLLFPFDMDFAFHLSSGAPLSSNGDLNKLISLPDNEHAFLGHLHDIITTSFNTDYMADWVTHFDDLLPNQNLGSILTWIGQRQNTVLSRLPPELPFELFGEPPTVIVTTLLADNTSATALVPSVENGGDQLASTWTTVDFVESADWVSGTTGVGYETSPADYAGLINLDVGEMFETNQSVFVRMPFDFAGDPSTFDNLKLRMKYDDGFVAYLNGVKVAESLAPANPTWNSGATSPHDDSAAVVFEEFDITDHIGELIVGQNVLAIHGLNQALNSSDLLILPEFVGEQVEEGMGGMGVINVDTPTVTIGGTGWVNVREIFLSGAEAPLDVTWLTSTSWEATIPVEFGTHDVTFEAYDFRGNLIGSDTVTINSTANKPVDSLLITEINYNPYDPTDVELGIDPNFDNDDFEFFEVQNVGTVPLNLQGFRVTDGIEYTFPDQSLDPGEYAIVVQDSTAFATRYPSPAIRVLGEITSGRLSNAGERLVLVDGAGDQLIEIEYEDGGLWPEAADGVGPTLALASSETAANQLGKYYHWDVFGVGGSPGGPFLPPLADIVISEVLSNTDLPGMDLDAIEITNNGPIPVDISGAWLSDSSNDLFKYQLPSLPPIPVGGSIVFDESNFNPVDGDPLGFSRTPFSLNGAEGDDVWLVDGALGNPFVSVLDHVDFGAAISGESFGRDPNAPGQMIPMRDVTLGAPNSAPRVGPLIISEVNYNPGTPSPAAVAADPNITANDLEFIEVRNPTSESVDLSDWRIRGGIDLNFDDGTVLAAGEVLVVISFNPTAAANASRLAAFRAHYGIDDSVAIVGGYADQLNNDLENIILQRPENPPLDDPTFVPYVIEDLVIYDDVAPWPVGADGLGDALQRIGFGAGTNSAQWNAAPPTPGSIVVDAGDLNDDGTVDAHDIDLLFAAINENSEDPQFDVDDSGDLDNNDVTYLVETILGRCFGDANLDGRVDSTDLNRVGIHWQAVADVGWADGEFTGDGMVNSADLNLIGINWQKGVPAQAARTPRAPLAVIHVLDVEDDDANTVPQGTTDGGQIAITGLLESPLRQRTWYTLRRRSHDRRAANRSALPRPTGSEDMLASAVTDQLFSDGPRFW